MTVLTRTFLVEPYCQSCPSQGTPQVPPAGEPYARLAIVGEGPGQNETLWRKPFVGNAGKLLNWLLREAGLRRDDCWLTNTACCEPERVWDGKRWWSKAAVVKGSAACCRSRLIAELSLVNPAIVLACGATALEVLTGRTDIISRHGALHRIRLTPDDNVDPSFDPVVIPMLHPAHLLRGQSRQTTAVIDVLKKVRRLLRDVDPVVLRSPQFPPLPGLLTVSPYEGSLTAAEFIALANHFIFDSPGYGVDVETTNEDARTALLTMIGFGTVDVGVTVTLKAWDRDTSTFVDCWSEPHWALYEPTVLRLLAAARPKWFWNVNFDSVVLDRWRKGCLQPPVADGIHYHWLRQPDVGHGLAFAAQSLPETQLRPWKADFWAKRDAGEATHRDWEVYNGQDAVYTARAAAALPLHVKMRQPRGDFLIAHQMRVTDLAREAMLTGVPVDLAAWEGAQVFLREKQAAAFECLREEVGGHLGELNAYLDKRKQKTLDDASRFNPRSPYHASWLLYEHLGLPVSRMTAGGQEKKAQRPSCSAKAVVGHLQNPVVKAYVDCAEMNARLLRLDEFRRYRDEATGRIHVPWNVTGQAGTRFASKHPNLQNLDKFLKKILVAPEGLVWVGADAAQIEARILSCLAGVKVLLELYNRPSFDEEKEPWKKLDPAWDSHALLAYLVYGDDYLNATDEQKKSWRTLVKRIYYGMGYGAYPKKIWSVLLEDKGLTSELRAQMTLARVTSVFETFHEHYPEVNAWANAEMDRVLRDGYQVIPPFGRRRYWPRYELEAPKLRNTPVQLAAGDVVNLLFCRMSDEVHERGMEAKFVVHGHDACGWLCPEAEAEDMRELVNRHFHYDLPGPVEAVHIWGSARVGRTYADVS